MQNWRTVLVDSSGYMYRFCDTNMRAGTTMDKQKAIRDENKNIGVVIDDGRIQALKEHLTPEELYDDLISRVKKYHPSDDISLIEKAYQLAAEAHKTQVRKSGEPYIIHPLYVSIILADLELDKETIAAGLLHDVLEDTIMTEQEMEAEFGKEGKSSTGYQRNAGKRIK